MDDISLPDAKEHLEELLARAVRGEDVRITDPKVGTVKLTAVNPNFAAAIRATDLMEPFVPLAHKRVPGRLVGIVPPPPDDFFDPLPDEELKHWYGE
jgi:antitoxin (DNA-binding transcriptional repressor) of toxin-antitoxin stability system